VWEEFKEQKNTPEAMSLREQNTEKAKNIAENPHHLGSGGHAAMPSLQKGGWRRKKGGQLFY
jgi:hypothetical protein